MPERRSKGAPQIEPIALDKRFAAAQELLTSLRLGHIGLEQAAALLRVEYHLDHRPQDKRAQVVKEQLKQSIEAAGFQAAPAAVRSTQQQPMATMTAIEEGLAALKDEGQALPANAAMEKLERIAKLESRARKAHKAIVHQTLVVEQIRGELSATMANKMRAQHRALVLGIFRSAQAFASAADAEREFKSIFVGAGFQWRPDLLPAVSINSAIVLGSEADPGSEITRVRKFLEELKVLQQ